MSKVRNLSIVINVKPSGFPVDIRSNGRPLLKVMLGCPKCYDVGLTDSIDRVLNRNFNRKLVIKWSISRVVRIIG